MVTVKRYVVHEIHKKFKEIGSKVEQSENLGLINDSAQALIEACHNAFSESPLLKHARFSEGESNTFHTALNNYLVNATDDIFFDFSKKSIDKLNETIHSELFAVGGYYLFVDYEIDGKHFVSVILLRKKNGFNFIKKGNVFLPGSLENLNIDKIGMGFRLNNAIYNSKDKDLNYIALITSQADKLSSYFKEWVQAAGVISDEKNSSALISILNGIPLPTKEDGTPIYTRDEFKKVCYDYAETSKDKFINLFNLSSHLYGEEEKNFVSNYASSQKISIDPEFKRNNSVWKRLIMIKAKVEGIELNVNVDKLNPNEVDIKVDRIIIKSKSLIEQITQQRNQIVNEG